ncbi:MAG: PolC-type DNA polymerase III [Clostridia bacterium]|nr:PolC-type DNA polymerase III [Clostridia bacterium]
MSPTNVKLSDVFPNCEIPEELSDVCIYTTDANATERTMSVTVQATDIIPYGVIENFKKYIAEKYALSSFVLKVRYQDLDIADIDTNLYYSNLIFYVNELIPGVRHIFQDSFADFSNNTYTVHCKYGIQMIEATGCEEMLKRLVQSQLGCSVDFVFVDECNPEEIEKLKEESIKKLPKIEYVPEKKESNPEKKEEKSPDEPSEIILGKPIKEDPVEISSISPDDMGDVVIKGIIMNPDSRELRNEKVLYTFFIADNQSAYSAKCFLTKKQFGEVKGRLKDGVCVKVKGKVQYDNFKKENTIMVNHISEDKMPTRKDNAEIKRVELHMHTKMSQMDGMTDAKTLVKQAIKWGHPAVAITDHGNVQAFPDAMHAAEKSDLKVIYGMECYLINDSRTVVYGSSSADTNGEFVVFDIETTGFSAENDRIIEIGAVRVKNREITDTFSVFVNPERPIPAKITELTGIDDDMVKDADIIENVIKDFYEFVGDAVLVAHNASFDTSFIKANARRCEMPYAFSCIDTLELARGLVHGIKNYKLNTLCKHFNISLENHHRACDDAGATADLLIELFKLLNAKDVEKLSDVNTALAGDVDFKTLRPYHCIILAKDLVGLRNLYELISKSCLEYFHKRPRIPKSLLQSKREGLIIGSACEAGELYTEILKSPYNPDFDELEKIIEFYDYLEIQPLGNNQFLIENGTVSGAEDLKYINKLIIELGKKYGKMTVATCDVHFMNPEDEIFRRILMAGQGYSDADSQPPLYFRTTDEMLREFDYLGDELAYEVVVENTNKIAEMTEKINPVPPDKAPPVIEGSDDLLRQLTYDKAISIYGENMPQLVRDRMDVELNSIINNGYSVLYIIAQKLVAKSLSDGYLVGSRGSVGSSFVAFLSGITEVNSLPPHYVCPECKYNEFLSSEEVGSGYDLPPKNCPECGAEMIADGQDIPFETFLGFSGNKEPDIDLNFSGDYQPVAHKYVEELFGTGHVFRAGTVGTVAEKTAYGYVKKYYDERGQYISNAQAERLVRGCTGVKRTTGQHPGGIIVVPTERDVHEFSPIQHPADDVKSDIITLHFDYHSIDQNLLKLDILGHDDPTVIRMLEDLTEIDLTKIPMGDPATMSLFSSTEALGVKPEDIESEVGTYAVPEFGTKFVRQMLLDTMPTTFSELVRISGLSHGTDVWLNNAQDLIKAGTTTLSKAICTRDDIMIYLIHHGLPNDMAFKIMESVRKGKGLTPDMEALMKEHDVPDWYIMSCKKIKYMFPKAHAVAYVTMAYRIAYCKVHYPKAFYATYFTVRADDFDYILMGGGKEKLLENKRMLEAKGNEMSDKEKNVVTIMEVCNEMYARGIKFLPVDLYKSHSFKFKPTDEGLLPPLNALPNLGTNAAKAIEAAREEEEFGSIEDLQQRSKVTKTVIEVLREAGVLKGLPESSQLTFF